MHIFLVKLSDFGNSIYDVNIERGNNESYSKLPFFPSTTPSIPPHRIQTRQYRFLYVFFI
jgi:hypothetical protein